MESLVNMNVVQLYGLVKLYFKLMLISEFNFRTIMSKELGHGLIMELMEESLEEHLTNKRIRNYDAQKIDFTIIPISSMINWLRKVFSSNYSRKKADKNLWFHFNSKKRLKDVLQVEWFFFRVKNLSIEI